MAIPPEPDSRSILPPSERGQDEAREGEEHELLNQPSRPLTPDEVEAADADPGRSERVYAPESERVAKPAAPGDREVLEHQRGGEDATRLGLSGSD